jgi:hypothetical protein
MKKVMILSALALAAVLATTQPASAWHNIKFGAGVNLHWQSGDNNLLWGVFRNGQIPHPAGIPGYGYGGYDHHGGGFPSYYPISTPAAPADAGKQAAAAPANLNQVGYPYNPYSYYQPVSYNPYNPYQVPANNPGYYPYQAPSYWYGQ